jgi:hypothetical protein
MQIAYTFIIYDFNIYIYIHDLLLFQKKTILLFQKNRKRIDKKEYI